MEKQAMENRDKVWEVRGRLLSGAYTYDEAETELQPTLDGMNSKGKEVAKL